MVIRLSGESDESYSEREQEQADKALNDYLNSDYYLEWEAAHKEWREATPNWQSETRYPELISGKAPEQHTPIRPEAVEGETYTVSARALNMRAGPSKTATQIGTLKQDDLVELINAENESWWLIDNGMIRGYVSSQYLKGDPYLGWEKKNYRSGITPECENVNPKYDYKIDNYLRVIVGSNTDVVVKLMQVNSPKDVCVRVVYVSSGDVFSLKNIPEGKYYLKLAYGNDYRQKIVDDVCYIKFTKDAIYEKGTEELDYYKIKKPNQTIGNSVYESWDIPSYELHLEVVSSNYLDAFDANKISEEEFNR